MKLVYIIKCNFAKIVSIPPRLKIKNPKPTDKNMLNPFRFFKTYENVERNQTHVKSISKFLENVLVPSNFLKTHREHVKTCKNKLNP